jgi:hypothetical protein
LGALLVAVLWVWCPAVVAQADSDSRPANAQRMDATEPLSSGPTDVAVRGDSTPEADQALDPGQDSGKLRDRFNSFQFSDELPSDLDQAEFEASLRDQFYGTYVFYQTLPADGRQTVYNSYRVDPHIASIRAATLELLR